MRGYPVVQRDGEEDHPCRVPGAEEEPDEQEQDDAQHRVRERHPRAAAMRARCVAGARLLLRRNGRAVAGLLHRRKAVRREAARARRRRDAGRVRPGPGPQRLPAAGPTRAPFAKRPGAPTAGPPGGLPPGLQPPQRQPSRPRRWQLRPPRAPRIRRKRRGRTTRTSRRRRCPPPRARARRA